jgi:hypothetical protein
MSSDGIVVGFEDTALLMVVVIKLTMGLDGLSRTAPGHHERAKRWSAAPVSNS